MKKLGRTNPLNMSILHTSYNIDNMLLTSANCPTEICDNDFAYSVYSDRLNREQRDKFWELNKRMFGQSIDTWAPNSSAVQVLEFCKEVFKIINPDSDQEITGCQIVRFSDIGGYGIHRFDFVGVKPENQNKVIYNWNPLYAEFSDRFGKECYSQYGTDTLRSQRRISRAH